MIKSPSKFPIYQGDSPIFYTYKSRGFLKSSMLSMIHIIQNKGVIDREHSPFNKNIDPRLSLSKSISKTRNKRIPSSNTFDNHEHENIYRKIWMLNMYINYHEEKIQKPNVHLDLGRKDLFIHQRICSRYMWYPSLIKNSLKIWSGYPFSSI